MNYRIITHDGCLDGYCSAFIIKRYWKELIGINLDAHKIQTIEVIGLQPKDVQTGSFEFQEGDIVLDLPRPTQKVFFWCDHHITAKPNEDFPSKHFWEEVPSCSGLLLEIANKQGMQTNAQVLEFKEMMDKIDGALYTIQDIYDCYYPIKNYEQTSMLQQLHMVGTMFHTRDPTLNQEIFRTLLSLELGDTPISTPQLWKLNPQMFHRAQMEGYKTWRECVDPYLEFAQKSKTVIQDDRKIKIIRGVYDRFYSYLKFSQAAYSVSLRVSDEGEGRISIGSNIFHKERCTVDIGRLCFIVGKKFGEGAGGGHYYVGGATIKAEYADAALTFILTSFERGKIQE